MGWFSSFLTVNPCKFSTFSQRKSTLIAH